MRTIRRLSASQIRLALLCLVGIVLVLAPGCERSSRDAEAFTSAGVTHLQMREYDRAIRDFDRALARSPDLAPAIEQRGRVHFYLGNFAQAAADLQRGLTL